MSGRGHLTCFAASLLLAALSVYFDQLAFAAAFTWRQYAFDFAVCWVCLYTIVMLTAAAVLAAPCSKKHTSRLSA